MLRITVLNDARVTTFKMEGKLAQEWVIEAQKAWTTFANIPHQERIVVDLCGVSFVDDPGRELLAQMHLSGAKLIGTGPMTSALIEEICGDKRSPKQKWIRSALGLFFLVLIATTVPCNKNSFHCGRSSFSEDAPSAIHERIVPTNQPEQHVPVQGNKDGAIPFPKGLLR